MRLSAVCVGALALSLVGSSVAFADPNPPAYRSYAGVGSDTTQDVLNGLSNGTAGINGGAPIASSLASYNAFGSDQVQTKSGGPNFARPAGSGAGVRALSASNNAPFQFRVSNSASNTATTSIQGQVNFARSSSRPSSSFPGDDLAYLPFARDAVSVAGRGIDGDLRNFTPEELRAIYSCTSAGNVTTSGTTVTYNNGSTVNQVLRPLLPQADSGTRSFFLSAIGVTAPIAACVTTVGPENDGNQLTGGNQIIPFSAGQWIGQKNGAFTNTVSRSSLLLFSIGGSAPTSGTAPNLATGPLFGQSAVAPTPGFGTFARDVYNVIDSKDLGRTLETRLTDNLTGTNGRAIINRFGFKNVNYVGDASFYLFSGYTN